MKKFLRYCNIFNIKLQYLRCMFAIYIIASMIGGCQAAIMSGGNFNGSNSTDFQTISPVY